MPRICTGVFRHPCPVSPIHKTFITEDPPEPMVTMLVVEGGLIYLHKAAHGGFAAYEDGFTLLELCRKHYREAGLDTRQLDMLVR
jgi:2,4'-dihydroxyacetophenone dioxygenase